MPPCTAADFTSGASTTISIGATSPAENSLFKIAKALCASLLGGTMLTPEKPRRIPTSGVATTTRKTTAAHA